MRSSEVRDLLAVTERPDIIALAAGAPYTKALNIEKMNRVIQEVMRKGGPAALNYGSSEGYEPLRKWLADFMASEDVICTPDDIVVTDGSQQGLELLAKILVNPGDTIICEAPSYVGALNAFLSYQANIIQIPCDDNGIKVERVAEALADLKKKGITPRFIYVIPNFQNPSGVTMSAARRKRLVKLAYDYNTIIVEDNAYRRLSFEETPTPSIRSLDENVVYLGTCSKMLSPGLRVGWLIAPRPIREKIVFAKQAADLCSSSLTQRVVEEYFRQTNMDAHLKKLIGIYVKRRDKMLNAIEEFFPKGVKWTTPRGGFFIWATLPSYLDTTNMLAKAIEQKVAYVPGKAFFADGVTGRDSMRLNYSFMKESDIREGIRRLGEVIETEMELYRSLKV
jgi:2-aminoadipate transaminase